MFKIKTGLDLPIAGAPEQVIEEAPGTGSVAVLGTDFPGMKPTMEVREGDQVKRGQVLFSDKKNAGVAFTAPAAGRVKEINRGDKRALLSVVIEVDGNDQLTFGQHSKEQLAGLERAQVVDKLRDSGLWAALRTRPFAKVPPLEGSPHSLFVTAMDSNPLAADAAVVIASRVDEFTAGLDVVAHLTEGAVHLCHEAGKSLPAGTSARLQTSEFAGVHPAGLAGTHIHYLDPVSTRKTVWYIGYQDVIAVGQLFLTGQLHSERVVALGGPGVKRPRLLRTVDGANLSDITAGELTDAECRVISGSVFSGHKAEGALDYLGRYHTQVSVLEEDRKRRLLGYLSPGTKRHSVFPIYLSKLFGEKQVEFTTTTNGSARAMVPIGTYESVLGLDMLPTQLLRSLLVGDIDNAINLGCLELDEEDVALCTYACPGKYEYGPVLRQMLTQIEKEG